MGKDMDRRILAHMQDSDQPKLINKASGRLRSANLEEELNSLRPQYGNFYEKVADSDVSVSMRAHGAQRMCAMASWKNNSRTNEATERLCLN